MSFFCTDEGNSRKIISFANFSQPVAKKCALFKKKKNQKFGYFDIFFPDFYRNEEEFWNDTNLEGFYQAQVIYIFVRGQGLES